MDNLLHAAYQALPIDVLMIIASKVIENSRFNFNEMKKEAPEALTSVFNKTGWEGIILADFDDLMVTIRYDHLVDDRIIVGELTQILVYEKQKSINSVVFMANRNFVDYNVRFNASSRSDKRKVAMLAILIHRFMPELDPSTIKFKGQPWYNMLKDMF